MMIVYTQCPKKKSRATTKMNVITHIQRTRLFRLVVITWEGPHSPTPGWTRKGVSPWSFRFVKMRTDQVYPW